MSAIQRQGLVAIPRRSRSALVLGSMCAFVTSINQSIMSVAFPDLRRSFPDASAAQLSWVLNAYTIVAGATLIPMAVVARRVGRKRVLLTGLSVFTVAAVGCSAAPTPEVLIGARVVQALGWAMITPSAIAAMLADIPTERRATAIAIWGGVGGIATSLAPSLGAFLIDAIVRERERGNLELLITTPVKTPELMLAKITPYVFIGLIQVSLVLLLGRILFQVP